MSNKDIKKLALSKLCNIPFAYIFIYFSFLYIIIYFVPYLLSFVSMRLFSRMVYLKPVPSFWMIVIFLMVLIYLFFMFAMSFGYAKALMNNSRGIINFNIKESFYFFKNFEETMQYIFIIFLCYLYICLWQILIGVACVGFYFMFTLIFPLQLARILVSIIAIILFLGTAIYKMSSYIMAILIKIENKDMPIIDCINNSKEIMEGNISKFFFLELSFLPWLFLSLISLGIIYPFVMTYINAANIEFYNFINHNSIEESVDENDSEVKKLENKTIYLILTIALSLLLFAGARFNSYKSFYHKHFKSTTYGMYSR